MKKLIPAICLLLVSAVMLGTSTFAWFSMNTSVTATGMQIAAKSNNTYLLINTGDNDTAAEIQSAGVTTIALTVSDANAKVYPSKPVTSDDKTAYATALESSTAVTTAATAAVAGNWFTAANDNPGASHDSVKNVTPLANFTNYVITKTLYLTVASGANNANNLTVTPTITLKQYEKTTDVAIVDGKTYYTESAGVYSSVAEPVEGQLANYYERLAGTELDAIKVLVTTSDGGFATLTSESGETDIKGSNTPLTDSTVLTVNIYIYYDGSEDNVYTNNIAALGAATIELAFDVDAIA